MYVFERIWPEKSIGKTSVFISKDLNAHKIVCRQTGSRFTLCSNANDRIFLQFYPYSGKPLWLTDSTAVSSGVSGYLEISGNERTDSLTVNINKIRCFPSNLLPHSDFIPRFCKTVCGVHGIQCDLILPAILRLDKNKYHLRK